YRNGPSEAVARATKGGIGAVLYDLSYNKFYVDEIYDRVIVRPFRWTAQALFEFVDRFVIDLIFVSGTGAVVKAAGWAARWLQSGSIHRYLALFVAGVAALFFFTRVDSPGSSPVTFTYERQGEMITFRVDAGSGPSAKVDAATIRWDLDGNGKPDVKPSPVASPHGDTQYLADPVVSISARDAGDKVTLWYTDPVFGDTIEVVKTIVKDGSQAGGSK